MLSEFEESEFDCSAKQKKFEVCIVWQSKDKKKEEVKQRESPSVRMHPGGTVLTATFFGYRLYGCLFAWNISCKARPYLPNFPVSWDLLLVFCDTEKLKPKCNSYERNPNLDWKTLYTIMLYGIWVFACICFLIAYWKNKMSPNSQINPLYTLLVSFKTFLCHLRQPNHSRKK